jgi:hypothetical protein
VTIASHAQDPEQFSHIFPEVRLERRWIPVDAGRRSPAWAKGPSSWYRRGHWDCDTGAYEEVSGATQQQMGGGLGIMPMIPMQARARFANTPTYYTPPNTNPRRMTRIRRRRMAGLGDAVDWSDPATWGSISSIINSGSAAASNIIAATRATPTNLFPTTSPTGTPYPYGVSPYAAQPQYAQSGFFGMSTGTLLLLAVVGVVFAASRR